MFGFVNGEPFHGEPFVDDPAAFPLWYSFLALGQSCAFLLGTPFWLWMMFHCYRHEPDRTFWLWMMIIFPPASLGYFALRWLPQHEVRLPAFVRRWTRKRDLDRLELAAVQIGNAYQHVQYGDALRELREWRKAGQAYHEALEKDPANLQALWGAALVDIEHRDFAEAGERLGRLLAIDPQYKFGDVSLAYARVLMELGRWDDARAHLEKHVQRWRQPEAFYLLATIQADEGEHPEARRTLQAMLMDINSCPRAIARRYGIWKSKARRLLKRLSSA